jgi:hypothetical protein
MATSRAVGRKSKAAVETPVAFAPPPLYEPPDPEGAKFLFDTTSLVSGIRGPFGSGKSVLCCHRILKHCQEQAPYEIRNANGRVMERIRYSRWAIIRNTFPELKLTTVKTWRDWVPDHLGKFAWSAPYTHYLDYELPDGTVVKAEIIFLALDKPDDVKKLLSLELTGAFVNEAREVPKEIIDALTGRIGRYPSPMMGGPTWSGVIMDTNSPGEEHWWPIMAGDVEPPEWMTEDERKMLVKPRGFTFYTQPPAMLEVFDSTGKVSGYEMNPERANKALPDAYYLNMIEGKSRTWIRIYVLNQYSDMVSGKAVYQTFSDEQHIAPAVIPPNPNYSIVVGIDYGRTPAAVFMQYIDSRLIVIDEFLLSGVSTITFARMLKSHIVRRGWQNFTVVMYGDPSGDDMKETSDSAPSTIMRSQGLNVRAAPTNDPLIRIEAVSALLSLMTPQGPSFVIGPNCHHLIAGFRGAYHFAPIGGLRSGQYDTRPKKNRASHPHDALQYGALGAGAWRPIINSGKAPKAITVQRGGSPFQRMSRRADRLARRGR